MKTILRPLFIFALFCLCACQLPPPQGKGPEQNVIRIACDRNFAPFTYVDPAGIPAGMLVDLWNLWVEKTGQTVRFVFSDWDGSVKAVKNGSADFHSGLFENESRAKWMDFSLPIYQSGIAVFVPKGGAASLAELDGKNAGGLAGGGPLSYLAQAAPKARALSYKSYREMIGAVLSGKCAAFADEEVGGWTALANLGVADRFTTLSEAYTARKFHAGVRKGNGKVLMMVNQGLSLITPGEMATIEARYIPEKARQYGRPRP